MERENQQSATGAEDWRELPAELDDGEASGALDERRAHLWALVLEARYLPCRLESGPMGWRLQVPEECFALAQDELRLYEEENRNWPPPSPPGPPLAENTLATLAVLILLATFHNLTRLDAPLLGHVLPDWFALGSANAAKIRDGQWWRLVTALTLHADWLHLFSNLALGGIFIIALCRELGSGLAWCLLIGAGSLGNLANAFMQQPEHNSVGASTLVFGAIGILAAMNFVRHERHRHGSWQLLPIAAALALLALFGTEGKNTDLGAHLFGFLFGIPFGLAAERLVGRHGRPGRLVNPFLVLASAGMLVMAWSEALLFGG